MPDYAQLYDTLNQLAGGSAPPSAAILESRGRESGIREWVTQRVSAAGERARREPIQYDPEKDDFNTSLQQAFPFIAQDKVPQLRTEYDQMVREAIAGGRIESYAGGSRDSQATGWAQTLIRSTPFVGSGTGIVNNIALRQATERLRSGEATEQDYQIIGLAAGDAQRQAGQGFLRNATDVLGGSIAFGGELATGGILATGTLRAAENTSRRMIPSQNPNTASPSLSEAALMGTAEAGIDVGTEFIGGPLGRVAGRAPGLGRASRFLTPGSNGFLRRAGVSGLLGEMLEERVAEIAHGAIGTQENYGATGATLTGISHATQGDWDLAGQELGTAFQQLALEGVAFGARGTMGNPGWRVVGRYLGFTPPAEGGPPLLTLPPLEGIPQEQQQAMEAQVEQQNGQIINQWLESTPIDNLQRWVGHMGITQETINTRLEMDRQREAAEQAQSIGQADAEIRQKQQELFAELDRAAQTIRGTFDQALNQVREGVLNDLRGPEGEAPNQPAQPIGAPQTAPIAPQITQDFAFQGTSFTTSQGSEYVFDGTRSQRRKTAHQGHDPADVGLKSPSEATFFISPEAAREVGMWQTLSAKGKRAIVQGDQIILTSLNPQTGQRGRDGVIPIVSRSPKVGLSPLELWDQGQSGFKGSHPGNAITSVQDAPGLIGAPQAAQVPVQPSSRHQRLLEALQEPRQPQDVHAAVWKVRLAAVDKGLQIVGTVRDFLESAGPVGRELIRQVGDLRVVVVTVPNGEAGLRGFVPVEGANVVAINRDELRNMGDVDILRAVAHEAAHLARKKLGRSIEASGVAYENRPWEKSAKRAERAIPDDALSLPEDDFDPGEEALRSHQEAQAELAEYWREQEEAPESPIGAPKGPGGVERRRQPRVSRGTWEMLQSKHPDWTVEQLGREAARIADQRGVDPVTSLPNVAVFAEHLQAGEMGSRVTIYDIPGMGPFNDTFGLQAGDALLKAYGEVLKESGIATYRTGGDELSGIFETQEDQEQASRDFREMLEKTVITWKDKNGNEVSVTGLGSAIMEGATYQEAQAKEPEAKREVIRAGFRGPDKKTLPPRAIFSPPIGSPKAGPQADGGRNLIGAPAQREGDRDQGQAPEVKRKVFTTPKESHDAKLRSGKLEPRNISEWVISKGGVSIQSYEEHTGLKWKDTTQNLRNVLRKAGQPLDLLAQSLQNEGWFPETESMHGTEWLLQTLENNPTMNREGDYEDELTKAQREHYERTQEASRDGRSAEDIAKSERIGDALGVLKAKEEAGDADEGLLGAEDAGDFNTAEFEPAPDRYAADIERARLLAQGKIQPGQSQLIGAPTPQAPASTKKPKGAYAARTPAEIEVDPEFENTYESFEAILGEDSKASNEEIRETLRILDTWASNKPTSYTSEVDGHAARQFLKDFAQEVAAGRKKIKQQQAKTDTTPFNAQAVAERIAKGVSADQEIALLANLNEAQVEEVEEAVAQILNAQIADMEAESARSDSYDPGGINVEPRKPKGRMAGTLGFIGNVGTLPATNTAPGFISQHGIIANIARRHRVPYYVHRIQGQAAALYAVRPEAVLVKGMYAGNAPIMMHEVAHDISKKLNLFPDVNFVRSLPMQVQKGFEEFDYDPRNHTERETAEEGFAEYLRLLATGMLPRLSVNQAAAKGWIDAQLRSAPGLMDLIQEDIKDFQRFRGLSPLHKAAGFISATGKPAEPELTTGQKLSETTSKLITETRKALENDQIAMEIFEQEAMKKGKTFTIRPSQVLFHNRHAAPLWAADWMESGVWGFRFGQDGEAIHRVRLGPSYKEITEGLTPQDLEPVYKNGVSRAETYYIARHVEAEEAEDRPTVGEATKAYFADFLETARRDPAFIERAERFSQKMTAAYNATVDVRAMAGMITVEDAQRLKTLRPTYADLTRVPEATAWSRVKRWFTGKGEALHSGLHARKGSDLPILAPFKSLLGRYRMIAGLLSEQSSRLALVGTTKTPGEAIGSPLKVEGMGNFMIEVEQPQVANSTILDPNQIRELMEKAGVPTDILLDMEDLRLTAAELTYFKPSAVPVDGKPTLVVMEQGIPHFYRIGDQGLYDLFVGSKPMSDVLPLRLLRGLTKIIKFGATSANPLFQMANVSRDAVTFARNSINPKSAKELPVFLYRANRYFAKKALGSSRDDLAKQDPWMTLYLEHAGEWTRQVNFSEKGIDQKYREITGQHGITNWVDWTKEKAKDILRTIGSSEHAPRVLEMKNRLLEQGISQEDVEKYVAGDTGAIPEYKIIDAMTAAAEVTTPFNRLGYLTRVLNLYIPFFGPAISGFSKGVRQAYHHPGQVAAITSIAVALETLLWLLNKDEPWYEELNDDQRSHWYVFRIGNTLYRFPKARNPEMAAVNGFGEVLRAMSDSNPRFHGWVVQSVNDLQPFARVQPEAPIPVMPALPAGIQTAWDIGTNTDWKGDRIIPQHDQDLPIGEQRGRMAQYALEQLSGGLISQGRLRAHPFAVTSTPRQSLNAMYEELETIQGQRLSYGREHRTGGIADYSEFPQEQRFAVLSAYADLFREMGREGTETRIQLASALRRGRGMPSLSDLPAEARGKVEDWLGGVLIRATQPPDPDTRRLPTDTPESFRERSQKADRDRQRQMRNAQAVLQAWNLSREEQSRLLREALKKRGQIGSVGPRIGRLGVLR